jgi:hypothetical protein
VTVINRYISDFAGLEIPVIEVVGDKPGPLLSVVAGVHGCEYASMAGLRRWASPRPKRDESITRSLATSSAICTREP